MQTTSSVRERAQQFGPSSAPGRSARLSYTQSPENGRYVRDQPLCEAQPSPSVVGVGRLRGRLSLETDELPRTRSASSPTSPCSASPRLSLDIIAAAKTIHAIMFVALKLLADPHPVLLHFVQTRAPKSHFTQDEFRPPNMSHVKDLKLRSKLSAVALADKRAEKARIDSELVRSAYRSRISHLHAPA